MPAEMDMVIEPARVTFLGPFTTEKTAGIVLTNPSNKRITFKTKSTRKHFFTMRPGFGFVDPKEQICIKLACRPFSGRLSKRDRFTILLAEAPETKEARPSLIWKANLPRNIRRHVLPVTYVERAVKRERKPAKMGVKWADDEKGAEDRRQEEKEQRKREEEERKKEDSDSDTDDLSDEEDPLNLSHFLWSLHERFIQNVFSFFQSVTSMYEERDVQTTAKKENL